MIYIVTQNIQYFWKISHIQSFMILHVSVNNRLLRVHDIFLQFTALELNLKEKSFAMIVKS